MHHSTIEFALKYFAAPKIKILKKTFGNRQFKVLDVGAGNQSASHLKKFFPNAEYHGLDKTKSYNNTTSDFKLMARFYEIDLESENDAEIEDNAFDAIIITHVIEHLPAAHLSLQRMYRKLKPGGIMYVEWPHPRSLKLPSMKNSLNFYDDPTHVRVYTTEEILKTFSTLNANALSFGTVLDFPTILFFPIILTYRLLKRGYIHGPDFWYVIGFATHVLIKKP
jgi:SAM-dependent methyltransferase